MSQTILVGCADDLAALSELSGVECISYEEAEQRGLLPQTLVFRSRPHEAPLRELLPVVHRKEAQPFHGYAGKRRGRRTY